MVLSLCVAGTDRWGHPVTQTARTLELSRTGARLDSVGFLQAPGATIEVEYNKKKARFQVVWIGEEGTPEEGQVGVRCLEPGKNIWDLELPGPGKDDYQPAEHSEAGARAPTPVAFVPSWTGEERRKHHRYRCSGLLELSGEQSNLHLTGSLADVSVGGCYMETAKPLPSGTLVNLLLVVQDLELRAKGQVCVSHSGMGMGIAFLEMSEGDQAKLHQLIQRLASPPPVRAEVPALIPAESRNAGENGLENQKAALDTELALEFVLELLKDKGVLTPEESSKAMERIKSLKHRACLGPIHSS